MKEEISNLFKEFSIILLYGNSDLNKRFDLVELLINEGDFLNYVFLLPEMVCQGLGEESFFEFEKNLIMNSTLNIVFVESYASFTELGLIVGSGKKVLALYSEIETSDNKAVANKGAFVNNFFKKRKIEEIERFRIYPSEIKLVKINNLKYEFKYNYNHSKYVSKIQNEIAKVDDYKSYDEDIFNNKSIIFYFALYGIKKEMYNLQYVTFKTYESDFQEKIINVKKDILFLLRNKVVTDQTNGLLIVKKGIINNRLCELKDVINTLGNTDDMEIIECVNNLKKYRSILYWTFKGEM